MQAVSTGHDRAYLPHSQPVGHITIDKETLSRLIALVNRVPPEIIDAVGPAPSFGRVRWQEVSDALEDESKCKRARNLITEASFRAEESDKRFELLKACLSEAETRPKPET